MNKYITVMFPYPSGAGLHIGHWYNYAIVDSYCKIERYKGNSVFQPFGYDAFGLPTENYARKMKRDPQEVTLENISSFRTEMYRMNTQFEEKLVTSSPDYVKKTQDLFLKLVSRNLAYKALRKQCYCPSCQTVLANEQVIGSLVFNGLPEGGFCERCRTKVELIEKEQWFFRITDYKLRLIEDLGRIEYPEKTKKQQQHWLENLQDWCVSRQRLWGCPIPIPGELDTLDTFVDSSFYTIIYDSSRPVDIYIGGNEHACMHLIYARFITKFLYDLGEINFDEPFKQVVHQGMILGPDGEKMSKSRGNTINPDKYEPQLLRMYLMFINHYFEGGIWKDDGYKGCERFRNRFSAWINQPHGIDQIDFSSFEAKVLDYWSKWKTNKVVSEWMIFYNSNKRKKPAQIDKERILKLFNSCF